MTALILIRGGGDLASGVAYRLHKSGLKVIITELPQPLAVRRTVSFSEAVYEGQVVVEGVTARVSTDPTDGLKILNILSKGHIPVVVDPECHSATTLHPLAIVDARMTKQPPELLEHSAMLYIGLGPGFHAPENCNAVIETMRGHTLGRLIWNGNTLNDSSVPDGDPRRVLRAPVMGLFKSLASIGDHITTNQPIASVGEEIIRAPFAGILRGILRTNLTALKGMKIGDLDPRDDPMLCQLVSEKSLAIGGGVLEALLTRPEIRKKLWA